MRRQTPARARRHALKALRFSGISSSCRGKRSSANCRNPSKRPVRASWSAGRQARRFPQPHLPGCADSTTASAGSPGSNRRTLEVLVFEVIDLLDYRADAWLTALATCRLRSRRAAGVGATELGYYGFLGRLRPEAATGASGGYIQAPSMAQRRSPDCPRRRAPSWRRPAVAVQLTSTRVRSALRLLAGLRQGAPLTDSWISGRAAAARAQRRCSHRSSAYLFPLNPGTGTDVPQVRLCNGLDFAKAADSRFASLPNAQRSVMRQVRDVLADDSTR